MKYLYNEFCEDISNEENFYIENGLVFIRGESWSPLEIIKQTINSDGDNPTEKQIFNDWLNEKIEQKVDFADQFLKCHEQEDRFQVLIDKFKNGEVVPFVGAGLSIPSGYLGWSDFLKRQVRQTNIDENHFDDLLNQGKYEEAAQELFHFLKQGFDEVVEHTFECQKEISGSVQILPYVFKKAVITTNFDNVISRVYEDADVPFSEKISGYEAKEIRQLLNQDARFLVMVHGKASSRNRILTKTEYDNHYSPNNHDVISSVNSIFNNRTVLFIGCSLTIDRTIQAIKNFVSENGHKNSNRHYALLPIPVNADGEVDKQKKVNRQQELAECNIYPIWYPTDAHDESIEGLLMKLWNAIR